MVERLFLAVPRGCLQFVIVVFPDHTHLLFWSRGQSYSFSISVTEDVLWLRTQTNLAAWRCMFSILFILLDGWRVLDT